MALGKYPCANGLDKWADCCEEAITALKYMPRSGISPPKSERIIRNWFVKEVWEAVASWRHCIIPIRESFSYKLLVSGCTDFVEEKTLLQHMGEEIGNDRRIKITIDRTPKCHPEVAGEGIEYSWAMSKMYIRSVPINKRRTLSQFHDHVNFALSRTEGASDAP
eukprot:scaffold106729_cov29-Attheya_sp.AAC.1